MHRLIVERGIRKKSSLPFGKSASCPWREGKEKMDLDSPAENFNQYMVVKAVKTRLNIALHKLLCAGVKAQSDLWVI